jgi:APA family basic amino acid/polyamine antiporter
LLRILGVGFGVAVIVGDTIGSGILRTPGEIAGHLGTYGSILAVWVLGGVYALFCTLSVTELGTMLPFAGGWYVYSRRAMGDFAGFLVGSSDAVVQTVSNGYLAVAFGEFAAELQPAFQGHVKLLGVAVLVVLALLNWLGLRMGSRAQEVTSLTKAAALIAFVAACLFAHPGAAHVNVAVMHPAAAKGGLLLALVLSLQAIIISYDGWYAAIYFAEEDEDPAKNLPRSSIGGVVACAAIYVLVNLALFRVLPMSQFAGSHMPVADAAMVVLGTYGKQFILLISLVAVASTMNANTMIVCRILFAMARDRMIPQWVARVNSGGTPTSALLMGTLVSIALVLSGSFDTLVGIASVLFVANYVSGFT